MDIAALKALELPELKQVAAKHGIKLHHKAGAEKVLKAIIDHVSNAQPVKARADEPSEAPQRKSAAPVLLSEDDVRDALAKQLERDAFKVEFHGDDTFTMRCNGAEESMHMTTPAAVIKRRAESVARGAFKPRMVRLDGELVMSA
jgi:hypothetical protein